MSTLDKIPGLSFFPARCGSTVISGFPWYTSKIFEVWSPEEDVGGMEYIKDFLKHMKAFDDRIFGSGLDKQIAKYRHAIGYNDACRNSSQALVLRNPPSLKEKQAPLACIILAMYRLAEYPGLPIAPPMSPAIPHPRSAFAQPEKFQAWSHLNDWPCLILKAEKAFSDRRRAQPKFYPLPTTQHHSSHLLQIIAQLTAQDRVTKIVMNFVMAAFYLSHVLRPKNPLGTLPDFPEVVNTLPDLTNTSSSPVATIVPLDGVQESDMQALADAGFTNLHAARTPLLMALLISTITLFIPAKLVQKNSWSREDLYETAWALGNEKPALLLRCETLARECLVQLASVNMDLEEIIDHVSTMLKKLPLPELRNLTNEDPLRSWFCPGQKTNGETFKATDLQSGHGSLSPHVEASQSLGQEEATVSNEPPAHFSGDGSIDSLLSGAHGHSEEKSDTADLSNAPTERRQMKSQFTPPAQDSPNARSVDEMPGDELHREVFRTSPASSDHLLECPGYPDFLMGTTLPISPPAGLASSFVDAGTSGGLHIQEPHIFNSIDHGEAGMQTRLQSESSSAVGVVIDLNDALLEDSLMGTALPSELPHEVRFVDPGKDVSTTLLASNSASLFTSQQPELPGEPESGERGNSRSSRRRGQGGTNHLEEAMVASQDDSDSSYDGVSRKKRKKAKGKPSQSKRPKLDSAKQATDHPTTKGNASSLRSPNSERGGQKQNKLQLWTPLPAPSIDHEVHPVEQSEFWLPFVVDPFEPKKSINLDIEATVPLYKGDMIVVYGPKASDAFGFRPRSHDKAVLEHFHMLQRTIESRHVLGEPLHIRNPEKSFIQIMTEKEFLASDSRVIQEILQTQCICIVERTGKSLKFDQRGLGTLAALHKITTIEDLSIPDTKTGNDRKREGTLYQMYECSKLKIPKILNAHRFPRAQAGYEHDLSNHISTDGCAWTSTEGSIDCKEGLELPTSDMRWGSLGLNGSIQRVCIEPDGFGIFVEPKTGSKYIILFRPKKLSDRDRIDLLYDPRFVNLKDPSMELFDVEAILIGPGTTLIMPPNTLYATYTPENAICWGGYFYLTGTFQSSLSGIVNAFMTGKYVSNTSHQTSRLLLRRVICFYYQALVECAVKDTDPLYAHVPHLKTIDSVLDLLSLCTLCYLGNALDFQTYILPSKSYGERWTDEQTQKWKEHDFNSMPKVDRKRCTYARGLAREIIAWFIENYQVTFNPSSESTVGWRNVATKDFALTFIAQQLVAIKEYKRLADKKGDASSSKLANRDMELFFMQVDGSFSSRDPLMNYKVAEETKSSSRRPTSMGFIGKKSCYRVSKLETSKSRKALSYQELDKLGTSERDLLYYAYLQEKEATQWVKMEEILSH